LLVCEVLCCVVEESGTGFTVQYSSEVEPVGKGKERRGGGRGGKVKYWWYSLTHSLTHSLVKYIQQYSQ